MSDALHTAWANLLMGALHSAGVQQVVVSPGSRSTALALAAEQNADLSVTPIIDERSAAFFALGQARITGMPTVLVCTSGSAGAHYLPAVIESAQSCCPLIVVTADRPPELQDCSSNQTVKQRNLFGSYPRAEFDLGVPDLHALPAVARYAAQAVRASLSGDSSRGPGPVHINAPFRKPLEPVPSDDDTAELAVRSLLKRPHRWFAPRVEASDDAVREIVSRLKEARRPLIVAGPLLPPAGVARGEAIRRLSASVFAVAAASGAAVFAEGASGVDPRFDEDRSASVPLLRNFEVLLRAAGLEAEARPDLIIELGAPPISSAYAAHLRANADTPRITLAAAGYPNPTNSATTLIHGDAAGLLESVHTEMAPEPSTRTAWLKLTAELTRIGGRAAAVAYEDDTLSEATVAHRLTQVLQPGAALVLGNSLAVRDLDLFGGSFQHAITTVHQRGASGIDGFIATAAGVRSATPANKAVLACIGDVSALHDVGSIALLSPSRKRERCSAPLVLLVVNNGGGRIFAELPVAKVSSDKVAGIDDAIEQLFFTPPGDFLAGVASGFGVAYERVEERSALGPILEVALSQNRATVVEVLVPPEDGTQRRAEMRARIAEELRTRSISTSTPTNKDGGGDP
jgi:2-succinyl-5-enolpyruvyl-6-hydroxy-3-cyclohexene-1-carboxylate synthase